MVNVYDVDQDNLVKELGLQLKKDKKITQPEWSLFVKTGSNREKPPMQEDWWYFRTASILRRIYIHGPIGVSKLRTKYGSRKNRGTRPERFVKSSGKIIRVILKQLETAGFVEKEKKRQHKGRKITSQGVSYIDNIAGNILKNKSKASQEA